MLKCVIVWLLIGILISCCYDNCVFKYTTTVMKKISNEIKRM